MYYSVAVIVLFAVLDGVWGITGGTNKKIVPRSDGKIIGGKPTSISKHPHQLSLQYFNRHVCGASLVSETYVVTAAHCTDGASAEYFTVRAGTTFHDRYGKVVKVTSIHNHQNYSNVNMDNDIAVVQLSSPLNGPNINLVDLPTLGKKYEPGTMAVCTGWGVTSEGGKIAKTLQAVEVYIKNQTECEEVYEEKGYSVTERMICAASYRKDACQGDSGGPLVVNNELVGIVSWGYGCARPSFPGVYSNVAELRTFISEITGL